MSLHYSVDEPFRCRLCDRKYAGPVEFYRHVGTYQHGLLVQAAVQRQQFGATIREVAALRQ